LNAVLDYDLGTDFICNDMPALVRRQAPKIVHVIPTLVPRVNAEGNYRFLVRADAERPGASVSGLLVPDADGTSGEREIAAGSCR
jgi:hypothetical protein